MTILVEPFGSIPEVLAGFTNRLRFRFYPHHDRDRTITYELLGPYEIAVHIERPGVANAFVGRGQLILLDPNSLSTRNGINNTVGSQIATQMPAWEVQIDLTRELVAQIDGARRPSGDASVKFVFDWYVWVRERDDGANPPQYGNSRNETVNRRTGPSSYSPVFVSIAASDWFKVTEAYGFPTRRLVELVFPPVAKDRWLNAVNDLTQADREFDSRRDKPTLDYCEAAFEEILGKQTILGNRDDVSRKIIARLDTIGVDERKREMVGNLLCDAVLLVRRGKHHVDVAGHPEFDPNGADAELGLLVTKALLGFLSKQ